MLTHQFRAGLVPDFLKIGIWKCLWILIRIVMVSVIGRVVENVKISWELDTPATVVLDPFDGNGEVANRAIVLIQFAVPLIKKLGM